MVSQQSETYTIRRMYRVSATGSEGLDSGNGTGLWTALMTNVTSYGLYEIRIFAIEMKS
jgi:hypothetical protein